MEWRLWPFLTTEICSDFEVNHLASGKVFKLHKVILAMSSKVFRKCSDGHYDLPHWADHEDFQVCYLNSLLILTLSKFI